MASVDIFNNLTPPALKSDAVPTLTMNDDSPIPLLESSTTTASSGADSSNCSSDNSMSSSSSSSVSSGGNCEPLTMNDIKLFESMDLNGPDEFSQGAIEGALDGVLDGVLDGDIGGDLGGALEGALEESDTMLSNLSQSCKMCK